MEQAEGYLQIELPRLALEAIIACSSETRQTFQWQHLIAETYRELGEFEPAIRHFEAARQLRPADASSYLGLGWCYKRTGRVDLAIRALHEAARQLHGNRDRSLHALVIYNLSCYYALLRNVDQAVRWLGRALRLDSEYRARVDEEPDFDPVRSAPAFQALLARTCTPSSRRAKTSQSGP